MRKKVLVAPTVLLTGLHLVQPLMVSAHNPKVNGLDVGHYRLTYHFVDGHEGRPEVNIVDGGEANSHTYQGGSTSGPMAFYFGGNREPGITFTPRGLADIEGWEQRPLANTDDVLESTWDSEDATVTARLSAYQGVGVLHEYVYTNNSNSSVQIEGRRVVDTMLETDQVPIYSLGPGKGLYIRGNNYRLDYQMDLADGPDKYSGYAWYYQSNQDMKATIQKLPAHNNEPKDATVLTGEDTAIAMEWNSQTVRPGESRTFAYVVKISGNIDANASLSPKSGQEANAGDVVYLDASAYGDSDFSGVTKGTLDFNLPNDVTLASGEKAQILNARGSVIREVDSSSLVSGNKVNLSLSGRDIVDDGFRVKIPLVPGSSYANKTLRVNPNVSLTGTAGVRHSTPEAHVRVANNIETKTDVEYETIPVETETRENINLAKGETKVIQAGKPGREKITYEVTLTNGVETNRREVGREVAEPMEKRIIEVGAMETEVRQEPREEAIPFTHQVVENPEVFEGEERIIQEGVPGVLEIIDEVTYENGQEVSRRKVSESVKVEPVPEVLEVGTLLEERKEEVTQETIPFEVQVVENPDMHLGVSQVVQEGVNGVLDIIEEVVYHNGHEVERTELNRVISQEPVTQIIEEGTLVEEIVEDIQTEAVDYETEIVDNQQLEEGETRVVQEGQPGVKELIYSVTLHNGEEVDRVLVNDMITQDPVNEIIEEGSLVREILTEEKEESIGNEEDTRENPDLPEGEKKVIEEGQEGLLKITEEVVIENDVEVSRREIDREVLQEAINRVVEVGTGVEGSVEESEEVEIAFDTERVENKELEEGQERVRQEGEVGIKTITYTYETFNEEKVGEPEVAEEVTKEPVPEIIEVGVGVKDVDESTKDIAIPFDTKRVENPDLPEGEERIAQEGEEGVKRIITKQATFNEEAVGEPEVTEEVIKEPIDQIIEIGTYRAPMPQPVRGKVMPQPVVKQDLPKTGEMATGAGILAGLSSLVAGLGTWLVKYRKK